MRTGGMYRTCLYSFAPILLALLAGPLSFAVSNAYKADPSGLYLIVGSGRMLDAVVSHADTAEIGPYRAPFARLIQASPNFHTQLAESGYLFFPATSLAELCAIPANT